MNQNQWYLSWPVIIIAFIFFWPAGIVLLILRNRGNKQSVFLGTTDKKKYIIAGVVLIIMGLSAVKGSTLWGISLIAGGIALFVYAGALTKRAERNRQYIDFIVNQNETSIDNISSFCNVTYDTTLKELRQMITLGVLKNATIDEMARTITVQHAAPVNPTTDSLSSAISGFVSSVTEGMGEPSEMVTVACPGCGAKVVLAKGASVNCEYCDSPIVG